MLEAIEVLVMLMEPSASAMGTVISSRVCMQVKDQ